MKRLRLAVALILVLPAAGCVFAVGADDEHTEELRDRVRALERRIDRLEGGPAGAGFLRQPPPGDPGPGKPPPEKAR